MNAVQRIDLWLDTVKAPSWMDVIRLALGIFIFYKGFIFTQNFQALTENVASMDGLFLTIPIAHYISITHLVGGCLIAMGAYTRAMCLLNLPILIGAVIFNADHFLTVENHLELAMAIIVLALLALFFIYGGGRFSLDELRRRDLQRKKG